MDNALIWKPSDNTLLRFTKPKNRGWSGAWAQEGLDFYLIKFKEDSFYRKELEKNHKGDMSSRSDYIKVDQDTDFIDKESTGRESTTQESMADKEIYSCDEEDENSDDETHVN